jgi:hypothetical protein
MQIQKKQGSPKASLLFASNDEWRRLQRVVHVEFDRMGRHAETLHVLHLQFDVGIDHAVGEDTAAGQEFAILVQRFQGGESAVSSPQGPAAR